jgi:DNA-binding transcriptional ArsR family regulator
MMGGSSELIQSPKALQRSWRSSKAMVSERTHEHQQLIFAALADPMRRDLLVKLAETSPKTATQLAQECPITRQGILKHLTVLAAAGLVAVHQKGREKRYTLTPEPLSELEQWINTIGAIWDERLLRLKTFIEDEQVGE